MGVDDQQFVQRYQCLGKRSAALLPRYRDAMSAAGKAQKIPQRVVERSEIQGLRQ
jgi:hypothetical protein